MTTVQIGGQPLVDLVVNYIASSSDAMRLGSSILIIGLIIKFGIFLFSRALSTGLYDTLSKALSISMKAMRATYLVSMLMNCRHGGFARFDRHSVSLTSLQSVIFTLKFRKTDLSTVGRIFAVQEDFWCLGSV